MPGRLKLRARDAADLAVISACLQDALVSVGDMTFLPKERRFAMVLNRFRWEQDPSAADLPPQPAAPTEAEREDAAFAEDDETGPTFERTHCGVCFDRVTRVRMRGIDRRARDQIFALLAVRLEGRSVLLVFAGDATIRLEVDGLRCHLEDLGEGWPTRWHPSHPVDDGSAA